MRMVKPLTLAWVLTLLIAAVPRAQDNAEEAKTADKILAAKGLKRSGNNLLLAEEPELAKMLSAAPKLKKAVLDADKALAGVEKKVADNKKLAVSYLQERRKLNAALGEGKLTLEQRNKVIARYNDLGDRINLLNETGGMEKEIASGREEQSKAREGYIDQVLAMRKLVDQGQKKLAELADDAEAKAAVEQLNTATGKTFAIKESGGWQAALRSLKRLEESVLSEQIPLRNDGSNTLMVSVSFNGRYVKELIVDSGANLISLPHKMAREVGLNPDSSSDEGIASLADGRKVRVKRLTIPKVRVGKFEAENVACVVLPSELGDAPPLLGMSFLGQFSFKVDAANKKLTMSKIDSGSATKTSGKP